MSSKMSATCQATHGSAPREQHCGVRGGKGARAESQIPGSTLGPRPRAQKRGGRRKELPGEPWTGEGAWRTRAAARGEEQRTERNPARAASKSQRPGWPARSGRPPSSLERRESLLHFSRKKGSAFKDPLTPRKVLPRLEMLRCRKTRLAPTAYADRDRCERIRVVPPSNR